MPSRFSIRTPPLSPPGPIALAICALAALATIYAAGCRPPAAACGTTGAPASAASSRESTGFTWSTSLGRDHPLVGRIWDSRRGAYADPQTVWQRLREARFVLLGEKHDNPDHHRLQALALEAVVAGERRPTLAFEMFDGAQQSAIDDYRARSAAGPEGLGQATGWEKSGWPAFETYLPVVRVAFDRGLPIAAANLPVSKIHALIHGGPTSLGTDSAKLGIDRPFPATLQASLESELRASHCGALPESMVGPMALAQHARDATMARALIEFDRGGGAVLIAGAGHVRADRGVPFYLRLDKAEAVPATVAFVEVAPGVNDPRAYAAPIGAVELPFDFVWFTPRADDADPCASFKTRDAGAGG